MTATDDTPLVSSEHRAWLLAEADRLIAFARGSRLDSGGFGWLDERGGIEAKPIELWNNGRMTHVFALAHGIGDHTAKAYVEHGIRALRELFADEQNGGWFFSVENGEPVQDSKAAYAHCFVILAASSAVACGVDGARELLTAALSISDQHFWDEKQGLVVEDWNRDWTVLDPYRGINANMHTVECYLAAADATGDRLWLDRATRIADRVINGWTRRNDWRIPEHFDADWNVLMDYSIDKPADPFRPYGSTIGHGLEWSRLCLHLRAAHGPDAPEWLLESAIELYRRAVTDGWQVDGEPGFVYTVDWSGTPVVRERMHWVPAEAVGAAAALHKVTGDPAYAADYRHWWDYLRTYTIDLERGSWRSELTARNEPSATVWSGKPDVYHALQTTLIPLLPLTPSIGASVSGLS